MAKRFMPVTSDFVVTSGFGPRWGTEHRGTDYGRNGGCGGLPVFASQGGTVVHAGAASGFGGPDPAGWIVVDHSTEDGSGTTVYGHVVREVSVGQRVEAGQRIGYINPNEGSNGGVGPHLHFEYHPYSWLPGSQRDPQVWLSNSTWPDHVVSDTAEDFSSTLFGVDISEHQKDYSLRQVESDGIDFVILRLCDGTHVDKLFKSHLADAESTNMLVSTYWYLRAPSEGTTIAQQVDVIDRQLEGRKDLGVWIDVESVDKNGNFLLTESDVWEAKRELERRGYYVPGIYSGAWYWEKMPGGEPSMEGLGYLWVSHYGATNAHGPYRELYRGDSSTQWNYPLGDRRPDILQYGSNGVVANRAVDVNAFRGSKQDLAKILYRTPPSIEQTATDPDFMEVLMSKRVQSLINKDKSFEPENALSLIDATAWENRVLLKEFFRLIGEDPDEIIARAKAADNAKAESQNGV